MSRLDIKSPSRAETVVENLYRDMERRIAASPPGLCPVDMALSFLRLCHAQSCGKCVPCRIGLGQLSLLLEQVLSGTATMSTLVTIEKTARTIVNTADCAIGRDAARLVVDGLEGFRDDYEEHILHHRCLAGLKYPVPCVALCPAGVDIPGYMALVGEGRCADAVRLIRKDNPFPTACAYICEHPCEARCRRNMVDDAINIRGLKRYAVDHAGEVPQPECAPATGKRVAIVGGGPSGLSCAYYLTLMGHKVTVYEEAKQLGGMLRYGIPNYRFPRHLLNAEIESILSLGIEVHTGVTVGKDISFAELRASSDAVVVATGTPKENALPIPNAECGLKAVEFLRKAALGQRPDVGRTVVIMGGGGVAFDCAFTARRLGAADVHVLCLEAEGAMRAPEEDLEQARREGVHVHNSCTMSGVRKDGDRVSGVDYFDVQECRFDEQGRLSLIPVPGGEHVLACDTVIFAVGMKTDLGFFEGEVPECTPRQWIVADAAQKTSLEGVFAAGDVASGPSSIAGAVGAGRRAAFGVHAYLTGENSRVYIINEEGRIEARDRLAASQPPYVVPFEEIYGVAQYGRAEPQRQGIREGLSFREINEGYTPEQARDEAARCMHCGHCKGCGTCVDDCPGYVLELKHLEERDRPEVAFGDECWHCANCRTSCPCGAIGFSFPLRMQV